MIAALILMFQLNLDFTQCLKLLMTLEDRSFILSQIGENKEFMSGGIKWPICGELQWILKISGNNF